MAFRLGRNYRGCESLMLDHFYSRDKPRDANCAHNAAERYGGFDFHLCFHFRIRVSDQKNIEWHTTLSIGKIRAPNFYQCVVPKAGDSAWNGNYAGSSPVTLTIYACVAQLDRATDYESVGWRFESFHQHHFWPYRIMVEFACLSSKRAGIVTRWGYQFCKQ